MRMSQVFVLSLRLCRLLCGKPMASRPQSTLSLRSGRSEACRTSRFKEPAPRNGTAIPHRKRRSRGTCSPVRGGASLGLLSSRWNCQGMAEAVPWRLSSRLNRVIPAHDRRGKNVSDNQHAVSIAVKPVAFLDGVVIGAKREFAPRECAYQHQQRGAGEMEVRE
jgi:hypothetical protein